MPTRQRGIDWTFWPNQFTHTCVHYINVIMTTMTSQITSLAVVYSIVYSGADQRKHQSSASMAFVGGIHRDRWIPRTKRPVTRKMVPFDDVITTMWKSVVICRIVSSCKYGNTRHMSKTHKRRDAISHEVFLTDWGRDKWTSFRRRHFQMHFLEWKCLNSEWNFTEVCSQGSN